MGDLWAAVGPNGLSRFNDKTDAFERVTSDVSSSNVMFEDQFGNFWIAALAGGLFLLDRISGEYFRYQYDPDDKNGLGQKFAITLYIDKRGQLWVGGENGISGMVATPTERLSGFVARKHAATAGFVNYSAQSLRFIMHMLEDSQYRFWVATSGNGLHLFDREQGVSKATYTTKDGLAHNNVRAIIEDDAGLLWLSTDEGLSRFDPETETFVNFYTADGLPSNIFHEHAHFKSKSGEIFFGGAEGLISFFPEDIKPNDSAPKVVLTGLQVSGKTLRPGEGSPLHTSISFAESITLPHDQNNLTLSYIGLHFVNTEQNRYQYWLENYDEEWIDAGSQRSARYPRLSPGEYVFRVKAANSNGVWNEEGASLKITITPPWWRTWWAYGFYGLLFITGIVTVDRVQRRRLIRKEREQSELRETELRAEAAELQAKALEAENARKTQELEAARKLQLSMLPQTVPQLPHLEIAVYMQPASEVGGDYYDFNLANDGALTAAIGDATGHGLQAGTMVATAKGLFNSLAHEPDLVQILRKSSAAIKAMGFPRLYMAMTLARFDGKQLRIAAAGMPYALLYHARSEQVEEIVLKGMPLGSFPDFPYQQKHVDLEPGDAVLLLSDGLEEMFNEEGEILGEEHVKTLVAEAGRKPVEEIISHLKQAGDAWAGARPRADDVTMVVMKMK